MDPSGESNILETKGRGGGPWRPLEPTPELRRPRDQPTELRRPCGHPLDQNDTSALEGCSSGNAASSNSPDVKAGGDTCKTSKLSADAKEFYPRNFQPNVSSNLQMEQEQPTPVPAPHSAGCYKPTYNTRPGRGRGTYQRGRYSNWHTPKVAEAGDFSQNPQPVVMERLYDVMYHLTLNPGKFDSLVKPLADTFQTMVNDVYTVTAIINIIFEQSVVEPNFRYNGARLCNFLSYQGICVDRTNFRALLLQRCSEEHLKKELLVQRDPLRLHGFVLFQAELYLQLEIPQGSGVRISVLAIAIIEILHLLLCQSNTDNLKCVCQVLKLTGYALEEDKKAELQSLMAQVANIVQNLNDDSNIKLMLRNVVELWRHGWGRATTVPQNQNWNNSQPQLNPYVNGPVFYGPDGKILTQEESRFLQESIVESSTDTEEYEEFGESENWSLGDDEMDDVMQAAFEQFLKLGPKST